ncbi:YybH family protein [Paraburkholderia rhynchosiae]|uniref:DUF4440 domain-containing protein n=1 Tax=Paraburkholderia rhynchosiae TaxID=487049 RepID=A0A2N7WK93_9BURK|nr:SgcJ/EcaC family oxidoreductase [Paraburkholderia rhynchosiae]PMS29813.1 DUF4440 domain-containing protein [Paraburkholderia rhynchosiae]CAB3696926.1 hypothetical protein LMG27174_03458 [Paraburkholderia rhynchosiae]
MGKHAQHVIVGLVAIVLSSSALAQAADARAIVERINSAWNQAFNTHNAQALAALYEETAKVSPGNGKTVEGRSEIEALFKGALENGFHDHSIEVIDARRNGNMAYELATWHAAGPEKDGKSPQFTGVLVNVFHKDADGRWRSISHIWNTAPQ